MQEIAVGEIAFPSKNNPFAISRNKLPLKIWEKGLIACKNQQETLLYFSAQTGALRALASLFIYTLGHFFQGPRCEF